MRITWKTASRVLVAAAATSVIAAGTSVAVSAQNPTPVYICGDFTSCVNGQYLEVFDQNGAPIFSVGQTGGADVFGDDFRLFGHNDPFNPEIVITDKPRPATCRAPEKWINLAGSWGCQNGIWVRQ